MKFLLLGNGKSIKSIIKFINYNKDEYIQAVFDFEYKSKYKLIDENLLELTNIDYVIKTPGISETNQIYLKLKQKFKFINELDLLHLYNNKVKTIVVTGSNGKTTFVSMLEYLLKKANKKVIKCGNSFEPITSYYKQFDKVDYLIIEQSSFQLHNLSFYKPYISIILNLQENHLDNSYSLYSYYENKMNIFKYQNKECYFIFDNTIKQLKNINFNCNVIELLKYNDLSNINENLLKYENNINYIYTIFKILGIDTNIISLINNFKELKYRQQIINYKNKIYINDSKSTSVDSTLFAINSIKTNKDIILIIGGKDKNCSLKRLNNIKVKHIICYGNIALKAKKELDNVILCKSLKNALKIAKNINFDDNIILFSPATSSLDQYKSYIDRAKHFNRLIRYEKD